MQSKSRVLFGDLAILLCSLLWGSSYSLIKYVIAEVNPLLFVVYRFGLTVLVMLAVFHRRFFALPLEAYRGALPAGLMLTCNYALSALGLIFTTAGNQAFITSTFVIITPLLYWAVRRTFPGFRVLAAAMIAFAGLCLLTVKPGFAFNRGDLMAFAVALSIAFNILIIDRYNKSFDPVAFMMAQVICALFLLLVIAFIFAPAPKMLSVRAWLILAYLSLMATLLPILLQNIAQRYTTAHRASVFMSAEGLFGVLFGCLLLGERLTLKMFIACALIFAGIVTVELSPAKAKAGASPAENGNG
jgi:drug/metabolite transporter (DMT)-like permease